jgi:hypothetical protein
MKPTMARRHEHPGCRLTSSKASTTNGATPHIVAVDELLGGSAAAVSDAGA